MGDVCVGRASETSNTDVLEQPLPVDQDTVPVAALTFLLSAPDEESRPLQDT